MVLVISLALLWKKSGKAISLLRHARPARSIHNATTALTNSISGLSSPSSYSLIVLSHSKMALGGDHYSNVKSCCRLPRFEAILAEKAHKRDEEERRVKNWIYLDNEPGSLKGGADIK